MKNTTRKNAKITVTRVDQRKAPTRNTQPTYNTADTTFHIVDMFTGADYDDTHTTFNTEVDAAIYICDTIYADYRNTFDTREHNTITFEIRPYDNVSKASIINGINEYGEIVKPKTILAILNDNDTIDIGTFNGEDGYPIATVGASAQPLFYKRARERAQAKAERRQAETPTEYPPITADNIQQVARAVATNKLIFLTRKSPTPYITDLLRQSAYSYTKASTDLKACILQYMVASSEDKDTADQLNAIMREQATAHTHDLKKALKDLNESESKYAQTTANDFDDLVQTAVLALWQDLVNNGGVCCSDTAFIDGLRAVDNVINNAKRNLLECQITVKTNDKGDIVDRKSKYKVKYKHLYIDEYTGEDEDGAPLFEIVDTTNRIAEYIDRECDNDTINEITALLTPTQREILKRVAQGRTYETIARALGLTVDKVKYNMRVIREKAQTINRY